MSSYRHKACRWRSVIVNISLINCQQGREILHHFRWMPTNLRACFQAVLEPENIVTRASTISVTSVSQLVSLGMQMAIENFLAKAEIQIILRLSVVSNLLRTQEWNLLISATCPHPLKESTKIISKSKGTCLPPEDITRTSERWQKPFNG